ncbi:PREDICTED: protein TSSC4 [Dinoponera quadriceps]|uniref:U5 small nuclear ribonucleoprotein TSSC4 n=1 Tax=Dinoponera quadriceps TaxID=609295 RepID=A0A6P3Y4Y0_DINQU|nr:PREDICTED: protein TSSC4 [Dinoponera quadriceps]
MHTSTNFVLRGGDAAFANRQKLLFDQLSIAENRCNKHDRCEINDNEMRVDVDSCNRDTTSREHVKRRRETRRFSGKESLFKRPEGLAPRTKGFRSVPDHHRNPHKWIKYSLADVSNEDMTEKSNTQAAMSFLKELKARRKTEADESDEKMDIESCNLNAQDCKEAIFKHRKRASTSQIVFRKPQTKETENSKIVVTGSDDKPMFRNSKIILPEYVIGQKPKKIPRRNKPVVKSDRVKELRLDHLEEPDEEEHN